MNVLPALGEKLSGEALHKLTEYSIPTLHSGAIPKQALEAGVRRFHKYYLKYLSTPAQNLKQVTLKEHLSGPSRRGFRKIITDQSDSLGGLGTDFSSKTALGWPGMTLGYRSK